MNLFEAAQPKGQANNLYAPLAERLRPSQFAEFVGQTQLTGPQSTLLKNLKEQNFLPNLILWGPPGTGKTTFARLLGQEMKAHFASCSAIDTGAKELRQIGLSAHDRRLQFNEKTLVFIDEIHRLNKSQQDVLLPFTESGDIVLIGATTENPSYELNAALLSRSQVLVFESLQEADLRSLLLRAAEKFSADLSEVLSEDAEASLIEFAYGDGRKLLNTSEIVFQNFKAAVDKSGYPLSREALTNLVGERKLRYDKSSDQHYDTISAFIKSVRGSDPDAAVYYLARMLEGGEDPIFIARRLVILASEDIGNADPRGLSVAVAGLQAVELIGMPEGRITLSQVTTYLASAPKSNRAYMAINDATAFVKETGPLPIPLSLRSSKTKLNVGMGYGEGYKYSHDSQKGYVKQKFLPEKAIDKVFYQPTEHGFEKNIRAYLGWLRDEPKKSEN